MLLNNQNTYIKISNDGVWETLNTKSKDFNFVNSNSRGNWEREGTFTNQTINSIEINIAIGENELIESCKKGELVNLMFSDGATIVEGEYKISNKERVKKDNNIYLSFVPTNTPFKIYADATVVGEVTKDYVDNGDATTLNTAKELIEQVSVVAEEAKSTAESKSTVAGSTSTVSGATTIKSITIDGNEYNLPEGGAGEVTKDYVDTQDQAVKDYSDAQLSTAKEEITSEVTRIYEAIGGEATERTGADNTLNEKIEAETTRATGVEDTITANLSREITNRQNGDNTLTNSINAEVTARTNADTQLQTNIDAKQDKLSSANAGTNITITEVEGVVKINAVGGEGGVSKDYVDEQDQSVKAYADEKVSDEATARSTADTTLQTNIDGEINDRKSADDTIQNNLDKEVQARAQADTELEGKIELKQNTLTAGTGITIENDVISSTGGLTVYSIELSGTSGTLTDEQKATLLSGSPTLNFIDKDGMLFKCVFYSANTKAVYSIAGESKIHVIEVKLPSGDWGLTTYELQPTLTAGEGISIENNVISATGTGDTYWTKQDNTVITNNDVAANISKQVFEAQKVDVIESKEGVTPVAGIYYYITSEDKFYQPTEEGVWPTDAVDVTVAENQKVVTQGSEGLYTFTDEETGNLYYTYPEEYCIAMSDINDSLNSLHNETTEIRQELSNKQDTLTAGNGLEIENNVIAVKGMTVYKDEDGLYIEVEE